MLGLLLIQCLSPFPPKVKIRQLVSVHLLVLPSCSPAYQPTFVFVPVRQVFVSCNFCGKSISYSCSAMPHQGRGFSQYGVSGSPTKSKVTSCPGCRKPLPRCALCLMNMGTPVSNCPGKLTGVEYVDRCSDDISTYLDTWAFYRGQYLDFDQRLGTLAPGSQGTNPVSLLLLCHSYQRR